MSGLPELNGVYGTFSGTRGLDLTPLQMKQKQQMFLKQLAQEQAAQAAQQAAQTRGLDLQQRGQDLGVQENDLARTFQQNLMTQRQGFDEKQSQLQREAAAAQQQAVIQEAQRAQGAGQQFAREEGAVERGFKGQQADADRAIQQQAMEVRKQEFEQSFGLESAKFDFMKDITLRDEGRKTRAEELTREMQDLQKQVVAGEINQRQAQTAMILKQTEAIGLELREALEDTGMSTEQYGIIAEKLSKGEELPGYIAGMILKSPKAAKAVGNLMAMMQGAQELGLSKAKKANIEAETDLTKTKTGAVKAELDAQAKAAIDPNAAISKEEGGVLTELQRKDAAGELGGIGKARLAALGEMQSLGARDDSTSSERRAKLRAFADLAASYEKGDFSDLTPSWMGAIGVAGTALEAIRLLGQGIARLSEDEREEQLRKLADELGLESGDFFPG